MLTKAAFIWLKIQWKQANSEILLHFKVTVFNGNIGSDIINFCVQSWIFSIIIIANICAA